MTVDIASVGMVTKLSKLGNSSIFQVEKFPITHSSLLFSIGCSFADMDWFHVVLGGSYGQLGNI